MKTVKQKKFLCITGKDAQDFQQRMNEALSQIEDPAISFPPSMELTAYITYEEHHAAPESLREEYEMAGVRARCADCPYFVYTNDMRRVWHYCAYHQKKQRADQQACESFFQQLKDGTIEFSRKGV